MTFALGPFLHLSHQDVRQQPFLPSSLGCDSGVNPTAHTDPPSQGGGAAASDIPVRHCRTSERQWRAVGKGNLWET